MPDRQKFLTPEEIEAHRLACSEWVRPEEFIRRVDTFIAKVSSLQYFTDTRIQFARDAWVAARIASISTVNEVRLVDGEWPDYEERLVSHTNQYEITEADIPGRRRGDEYRAWAARPEGSPKFESDPVEDWIARADQAPEALRRASRAKANKGYPNSARLVIYLNIGEYGIRQGEIEQAMAPETQLAKDKFQQIWVLWKSQLYLVWEDARLVDRRFPIELHAA